ncbi:MAG: DUF1580 domain-containing protein [Phycisphaerales bacterium]|nr:DUF1580 domain-containing protein [Phycisphaerales bacterium]
MNIAHYSLCEIENGRKNADYYYWIMDANRSAGFYKGADMNLILHNHERPIRLAAATRELADILPPSSRTGTPLHLCTIHRWVTAGIRGVRLEVVRCGGSLATSREAVERFFSALSATDAPTHTPSTPARRERRVSRAQQECAAAGI